MTKLEELNRQITAAFERTKIGHQEWIDGTLELATALATARCEFASDNKFSDWCSKHCPDLNPHDRAALINMAKDPSVTRKVLEDTKRNSWKYIWEKEMKQRFVQVDTRDKPRKERKRSLTEVKEEAVAKAQIDQGKPRPQVAKEFGIGEHVAQLARAREEGRREGRADAEVDPSTLSRTAQERLEQAIRQQKRKLDIEFEWKVVAECQRRLETLALPSWVKKIEEADRVIRARRGALTDEEFQLIRRCVHPDSAQSASPEMRNRAFQLLMDKKLVLVAEPEMPTTAPTIPTTLAEWQAAAERETQRRREQRAASRAAREASRSAVRS